MGEEETEESMGRGGERDRFREREIQRERFRERDPERERKCQREREREESVRAAAIQDSLWISDEIS